MDFYLLNGGPKAIFSIAAWNVIDQVFLFDLLVPPDSKNSFLADKGYHGADTDHTFRVSFWFNLNNGGNELFLRHYLDVIFTKLGNLPTRDGAVFRCEPAWRFAKDNIYKGIEQYCLDFQAGFSGRKSYSPPKSISKKLDKSQQALLDAINAGEPVVEHLRAGVDLNYGPEFESYFLNFALPKIENEKRNPDIVKENIRALLEFNAPTGEYVGSEFHTLFSFLLCAAYVEETTHEFDIKQLKEYSHMIEDSEDSEERGTLERWINKTRHRISSHPVKHQLHKDLIQLFLFLDDGKTIYYPVPQFLKERSAIFNWVAEGQMVLKLFRNISRHSCDVTMSVPGCFFHRASDGKSVSVRTLPLIIASKISPLITPVRDIYLRQFKGRASENELIDYFNKVLATNFNQAWLDVVSVDGVISAFNIAEFIPTKKDGRPVVLYHAVLAAAENNVTKYHGLMARVIYERGFLPVRMGVGLEVLTVIESASLASYLQLINMGVRFNPQYNILADWILILLKEIYTKETLYIHEEKFIAAGNYFYVSDPLADFGMKTPNPWQARKTTFAAQRVSGTNKVRRGCDFVAFFKNDPENDQRFRQYLQTDDIAKPKL